MLVRAFGTRDTVVGGPYEVNGSGKFSDIDAKVLKSLRDLSVDAVWYTGILNHATKTHFDGISDCNASIVKGEAGSPYAIRDYFDVDPALATVPEKRMSEFEDLVSRTHKAGMKVIMDFIPNHVFREYRGYFTADNFYTLDGPLHLPEELHSDYYENPARATGNDVFHCYPSCNDWYETIKLNYSNHGIWQKMLDILLFWAAKGIDGFRCDMVELVPSEFFEWAISKLRAQFPDTLFIAEVYGKQNYGRYHSAGFDLLYDKSGFYDTLRGITEGRRRASELTGEWQQIGDLQPYMLNFLENHDEQRVASDFFAGNATRSRAALAVSLLFNTASFLLYFGQEFGERGMEQEGFSGRDGRTSIFDYCTVPAIRHWLDDTLDADEKSINQEYRTLLRTASTPVFREGKTFDLMYANTVWERFNPSSNFVWMRAYEGNCKAVAVNFSDRVADIDAFIPQAAFDYCGIPCREHIVRFHVEPFGYQIIDPSK